MTNLPDRRPILSYYGDDFTGSTDAMDVLAAYGVRSVLFLRTPDAADLEAYTDCRAIGIAGDSRSRPPAWMRAELPVIFARLREIGAPVVQYKVCSTFDSSPETGSIGCALEIGREAFGVPYVPIVPAAPRLQRYVIFGNLFAEGGGAVHRIDRHPAMSRHPVTPMPEGDLMIHLGRQTAHKLALANILELRAETFTPDASADAVLFDGLEPADLAQAAQWIWEHRREPQAFVVGSSGFTGGILEYWRSRGWIEGAPLHRSARPADRLLVLAGSCSPATEGQIRRALRDGFHGIRLDALTTGNGSCDESVRNEALAELAAGRSVILYSALGPSDQAPVADRIGLATAMGRLLDRVVEASGVGAAGAEADGPTSPIEVLRRE